jgi:filamentous hemagglutinin family protein
MIAQLLLVYAAIAQPAIAGPLAAPDGTGTQITLDGNQFNIDGGTLSGNGTNLFHSFTQFNLDTNQVANFLANPQIQNILSRVVNHNPSLINGLIQITGSNANLYLMNPAGIIFGPGASLNVGGDFFSTTATGIGLNNGWFNAFGDNDYSNLGGNPTQFAFAAAQTGAIINAGHLTVNQGQTVALIGATVVNTGMITAPGGNIAIAAIPGSSLIKISQPNSLLSLEVNPTRDANGLILPFTPLDLPQLLAGSKVETGLTVNADNSVQTLAGTPIPATEATAIVTGTLSTAALSNGKGGNIDIVGDRVGLLDNAQILASGNLGGGNIRIGGDYQGQGTLPNAHITLVGENATIEANALTAGNGGNIITWADHTTAFYGTATARGANFTPSASPSNGGFIEISGKENLIFDGNADVSAPQGINGTILFDPRDIIVVSAAAAADDNQLNDNQILESDGVATDFTISDTKLRSLGGTIILQATRDITFAAGTNFSGINAFKADLDVRAGQDFIIKEDIVFTNNFGLTANAGRNITANAFINTLNPTGTGYVNLTAAGDIATRLINMGGSININSTGGNIDVNNATLTTNLGGTGQINLIAEGNINTRGISAGGNVVVNSTGANVTVNGRINTNASSASSIQIAAANAINLDDTSLGALNVVDAGGNIAITGNSIIAQKDIQSQRGNINLNAATTVELQSVITSGGDIVIESSGGNITANSSLSSSIGINPTNPNATGSVILQANSGDIQVQDINAAGMVALVGNNVTVNDSIDVEETTTAPSNITATNALRVETIESGGAVNLTSTNGDIVIGENNGNANEIRSSSRANGGSPGFVNLSALNGTVTLNGLIRAGRAQKIGDSKITITAARFLAINPGEGNILDEVGVAGSTTASQDASLFAFPANVIFDGNSDINTDNVGTLLPGQVTVVFANDLQNPTPTNSSSVSSGSGPEVIRIVLPRNQTFAVGAAFDPNDSNMSGSQGIIGLPVAGIPPTLVVLLENASFTPPDLPVIARDPQLPQPQLPQPQLPQPQLPQPQLPQPQLPQPQLPQPQLPPQVVQIPNTTPFRSSDSNPRWDCSRVNQQQRDRETHLDVEEHHSCRFLEEEAVPILDTSEVPSPESAR